MTTTSVARLGRLGNHPLPAIHVFVGFVGRGRQRAGARRSPATSRAS